MHECGHYQDWQEKNLPCANINMVNMAETWSNPSWLHAKAAVGRRLTPLCHSQDMISAICLEEVNEVNGGL